MDIDLTPYFKKYENLVAAADEVFDRVKKAHADCVKCGEQCADCCFALFDLTLIEALYIHHRFKEKFEGSAKVTLLEKANRADRRIYKIKRNAFKAAARRVRHDQGQSLSLIITVCDQKKAARSCLTRKR